MHFQFILNISNKCRLRMRPLVCLRHRDVQMQRESHHQQTQILCSAVTAYTSKRTPICSCTTSPLRRHTQSFFRRARARIHYLHNNCIYSAQCLNMCFFFNARMICGWIEWKNMPFCTFHACAPLYHTARTRSDLFCKCTTRMLFLSFILCTKYAHCKRFLFICSYAYLSIYIK